MNHIKRLGIDGVQPSVRSAGNISQLTVMVSGSISITVLDGPNGFAANLMPHLPSGEWSPEEDREAQMRPLIDDVRQCLRGLETPRRRILIQRAVWDRRFGDLNQGRPIAEVWNEYSQGLENVRNAVARNAGLAISDRDIELALELVVRQYPDEFSEV